MAQDSFHKVHSRFLLPAMLVSGSLQAVSAISAPSSKELIGLRAQKQAQDISLGERFHHSAIVSCQGHTHD